ncbi:hypothetical protein BU23DRAFT_128661 [Bimuria novae-zelandiae CBS 107.79]|uniref:Uncharacterized protein n=1 Tax=Bimuria novae-zelandiae CBS 107.79 TaxID=1447943 RepID=A0A6A5VF69_9PLEO|nr:hypothetical protein BU23DRAFT_128661 [Bimuria novae-zelandiae CBS 107.79]
MSLGGDFHKLSGTAGRRPDTPASSHARNASSQSLPAPVSTAPSIPGELQELRSLAELTKARVGNLEVLLGPPALTQVTETKRIMRDAYRNLERLQSQIAEGESVALISETTVEAWQVYQRLVKIEEKLRRAVIEPVDVEDSQPTNLTAQAPAALKHSHDHSRHSSGRVSFASNPKPTPEEKENAEEREQTSQRPFRLWTWPNPQEWEEDRTELESSPNHLATILGSSASPTVVESDPRFSRPYQYQRPSEQTDTVSTMAVASRKGSSEDLTTLLATMIEGQNDEPEALHYVDSVDTLRALYLEHGLEELPTGVAQTREEVERRCAMEQAYTRSVLVDPERKREGSILGFFATYAILAGIDDPNYCLPRLRFIKIHEVKRLKELLVDGFHLGRSGEISRIERVLHLIFVLQEGWRMETMAVLFSRTPQQVRESCRDVFECLLEVHSETSLEYYQPTCHHLWKIAPKFMDSTHTKRSEKYYHWKKQEVFNVLVTLNMYIGRYRQQGKVALDGPYQHWWRHFSPLEPTEWLHG